MPEMDTRFDQFLGQYVRHRFRSLGWVFEPRRLWPRRGVCQRAPRFQGRLSSSAWRGPISRT